MWSNFKYLVVFSSVILQYYSLKNTVTISHGIIRFPTDRLSSMFTDTFYYRQYLKRFALSDSALPVKKQYNSQLDGIMLYCRRLKNYDKLIDYIDDLIVNETNLSAALLTKLLKYLGEAHQLGKALFLMKLSISKGLTPNEIHYGALINVARRVGQWEIAYELFNSLESNNIKKNVIIYNSMIMTLGESKQCSYLDAILEDMHSKNVPLDVVTYSTVISAYQNCGLYKKSIEFYRKCFDYAVKPNLICLNAALTACVLDREWLLAIAILLDSHCRGIVPDTVSYSSLINVCGECRQFEIALKLFESMNSIDPYSECLRIFEVEKLILDPMIFTDYRSIILNQNFPARVEQTFGPLTKDTGTYNSMITACEKSGHWQKALDLLLEMIDLSHDKNKSNIKPDVKSFTAVITACGNSNQYEVAWKLYLSMSDYGIEKDTPAYNAIINVLQNCGQWLRANEVLLQMNSKGNDVDNTFISDSQVDKPNPIFSSFNSSDILQYAQEIYAESYESGNNNHWAFDSKSKTPSTIIAENMILNDLSEFDRKFSEDNILTMDLHGFPQQVAITAVDYVFQEFYANITALLMSQHTDSSIGDFSWSKELKIITGRGRHINSSGTKGVLRPAIENFINNVMEPKGYLQLRFDEKNDGVLFVTPESINNWIRAKLKINLNE